MLLEKSGEIAPERMQRQKKKKKKNAEMEPKQKQHPVVDVTGDGTKSDSVKSNIA